MKNFYIIATNDRTNWTANLFYQTFVKSLVKVILYKSRVFTQKLKILIINLVKKQIFNFKQFTKIVTMGSSKKHKKDKDSSSKKHKHKDKIRVPSPPDLREEISSRDREIRERERERERRHKKHKERKTRPRSPAQRESTRSGRNEREAYHSDSK